CVSLDVQQQPPRLSAGRFSRPAIQDFAPSFAFIQVTCAFDTLRANPASRTPRNLDERPDDLPAMYLPAEAKPSSLGPLGLSPVRPTSSQSVVSRYGLSTSTTLK